MDPGSGLPSPLLTLSVSPITEFWIVAFCMSTSMWCHCIPFLTYSLSLYSPIGDTIPSRWTYSYPLLHTSGSKFVEVQDSAEDLEGKPQVIPYFLFVHCILFVIKKVMPVCFTESDIQPKEDAAFHLAQLRPQPKKVSANGKYNLLNLSLAMIWVWGSTCTLPIER